MDWAAGFIPLVVILIVFIGMFYFLMLKPQRKRQQEHSELLAGLKRGDRVLTASGIYGEVEGIDEESVVLKIEDSSKLRVLKDSVVRNLSELTPQV
jgi:preprotein translocase subunit YajC